MIFIFPHTISLIKIHRIFLTILYQREIIVVFSPNPDKIIDRGIMAPQTSKLEVSINSVDFEMHVFLSTQ